MWSKRDSFIVELMMAMDCQAFQNWGRFWFIWYQMLCPSKLMCVKFVLEKLLLASGGCCVYVWNIV